MDKYNDLKNAAISAANFSYAPYSNFHVGAALLHKSGKIFTGCNVENRSYSLTICAERSAISVAATAGALLNKDFKALAIYCKDALYPVPPCGACRQVLTEFCPPDMPILFGGKNCSFKTVLLKELYPEDSLHELKNE